MALALREQVLDAGEVPMGERDWEIDIIVTPDEIIAKSEVWWTLRVL